MHNDDLVVFQNVCFVYEWMHKKLNCKSGNRSQIHCAKIQQKSTIILNNAE